MVHSFLPLLRSSGHRSRDSRSPPPRIVCISSISALYPIATFSGYSSSKAAVRAFCKAIAIELDWHNIRVSCVIPGAHKSPMTEQLDVRPARAWERLDPRTKAAYGEKFYASLLEQLENTRRFSVLPPISSAAERTADVLARWTPPGEVFVGWDCYLFWILEWLPWRWQVAAGRAFAGMVETPAFLLPAGTSQDRENKSE
ncbi:hypothetical protein DFJ74DRAFT_689787 [Hyaloraphidium curvatum]|nr:hypothetical protein DFJ74DRAFT_689787 [Hyaloraphidium curvatum]